MKHIFSPNNRLQTLLVIYTAMLQTTTSWWDVKFRNANLAHWPLVPLSGRLFPPTLTAPPLSVVTTIIVFSYWPVSFRLVTTLYGMLHCENILLSPATQQYTWFIRNICTNLWCWTLNTNHVRSGSETFLHQQFHQPGPQSDQERWPWQSRSSGIGPCSGKHSACSCVVPGGGNLVVRFSKGKKQGQRLSLFASHPLKWYHSNKNLNRHLLRQMWK